jgi:hypothetical protein
MLPGLNPDRREPTPTTDRDPQTAHSPTLERPRQFEHAGVLWHHRSCMIEEFVILA